MHPLTFFRPFGQVDKSRRLLPHWEQPDVCYFLTFRTLDSIPAEVMDRWQAERAQWLTCQGIDLHAEGWRVQLEMLSKEVRRGVSSALLQANA